jgi:hypothetical protein
VIYHIHSQKAAEKFSHKDCSKGVQSHPSGLATVKTWRFSKGHKIASGGVRKYAVLIVMSGSATLKAERFGEIVPIDLEARDICLLYEVLYTCEITDNDTKIIEIIP